MLIKAHTFERHCVPSADVSDKADNVTYPLFMPSRPLKRKADPLNTREIYTAKSKQKYTSNKVFVNSSSRSAANTNRHGYIVLVLVNFVYLHSTTKLSVHSRAKGRHIQLQVLCPGRQRSEAGAATQNGFVCIIPAPTTY